MYDARPARARPLPPLAAPRCFWLQLAADGMTSRPLRAAGLWNRALAAPPDSLLREEVRATAEPGSRMARQPWAQQHWGWVGVQIKCHETEVPLHTPDRLDLSDPQPASHAAVRAGCQSASWSS